MAQVRNILEDINKIDDIETTVSQLQTDAGNSNIHIANTSNPHSVTKTQVGLSNVDNTSDANKPVSTATQTALNLKAPLASPTFTGTVSGITKTMVGLGNVDNTSDANKPVSIAQQTALDLKANIASPTFTGTVSGITKSMVGLGSVDNTSDANKPVSIAQQTALDLKANSSTVSSHTSNTSNPHSTTANQVGAYTKAETEQLLSDTLLAVPQNIVPETDSIYSLGTSALKWSELHLSGSTIHLGDVTLKDNGDGTFGIYDKTGLSPVTIQSGEKVYATEDYVDTMAYTKVNMSVMDDMRDPTGFVRALPDTMGIIEFSPNGTDIYQIDQHSYFSKRSDGTFATGTIYETEAVAKRVVIYPVPSTGFIRFYSDAVKYEFTTLKYADVSSLDAMRYLYMDGSGLHASNLLDKELFFTNVALTTVIYGNDDTGIKLVFGDERHGIQMDGATHRYQHFTEGSKYYDGLEIQGVTNGSNTYTSTTGGTIYDEDIINSIELMTSNPFWYIDGTIWRTSTPNNNLSYNNKYCLESNGTYSLVDIPSGKYSCTHFLATNDREYPVVKIVGQNVYDTIDSARDLIITEASNVKLYGLPTPELIYIGSIIINDVGQAQELSNGSIITDLRKTKITGRGSESSVAAYASAVIYNNDNSGLTSTSVQNAITELAQEKAEISSVTNSLALKANIASPTFTGTVSGITKSMVGLGSVDNTSDANKPVSTATQTALNLKANIASPTFTGTVSGITKSMVGLGNVTNESKATMFTSPTFTGNAVLGTPASGNFSTGTFTWPTFNQNTTGNAATVSSITGNTGLMINRLAAPAHIDGLTTSNFRTTFFGTTTYSEALVTSRWNTTPTPLAGLGSYGTAVAWAASDTHGFLAIDYSTANAKIGGGNGNAINWTAMLIHSSNIGSQSVSYASSAGNADTLDGNHASAFQSTLVSGTNIKTVGGNSLLGSGDISVGKVLQVVTQKSGFVNQTISSTTPVALTNMSVTITPKSPTSKIIIQAMVVASYTYVASVHIYKNGSDLVAGHGGNSQSGGNTALWTHYQSSQESNRPNQIFSMPIIYEDIPGTTSTITYDIRANSGWSGGVETFYFNNRYTQDMLSTSYIMVTEIAN